MNIKVEKDLITFNAHHLSNLDYVRVLRNNTSGKITLGDLFEAVYNNVERGAPGPKGDTGASGIYVSDAEPNSPSEGQPWFRTQNNTLTLWIEDSWQDVGVDDNHY